MSPFPTLSAAKKSSAFSNGPLVSSMLALFWATVVLAGVMGVSRVTQNEVSAMHGPPSQDSDSTEAGNEPSDHSN